MAMNLVPATLKEASLDSPTFRGTVNHYSEQVELVDKWLDSFIKASLKLVNEILGLEDHVNNFLSRSIVVPNNVSESIIDNDYTLLGMEKFVEGSRGFWGDIIIGAKKIERTVVEPLLAFQRADLKWFKEIRRSWEAAQVKYDQLLARFMSQSKSKEPSSLREDAFQLYEARKAYMKCSYDFCVAAPTLRAGLDRTLTKVLSDMWRDQTTLRKESTAAAERCRVDIERIRMWSDAMGANAAVFRKQLIGARKDMEARSWREYTPGRELDEYSISTVPYLTSRGGAVGGASEKQGWLFMRTLTGKPTRSVWIRRWFFVRDGIFGWLLLSYRGGGVEESEKIGVLLCNIKPAFQEERRFCFEVKTKDTTILLQTETQPDLSAWLAVFEQAKRTAMDMTGTQAFSIIPPTTVNVPPNEPAYITRGNDGGTGTGTTNTPVSATSNDGMSLVIRGHLHHDPHPSPLSDRAMTLGPNVSSTSRGVSMDFSSEAPPVSPGKLCTRLDLHRKTLSNTGERNITPITPGTSAPVGISALIAASHNMLQFQPTDAKPSAGDMGSRSHSLTPTSLIGTPAPVNLLNASGVTSGTQQVGHEIGVGKGHRRTMSLDMGVEPGASAGRDGDGGEVEYPPGYPLELRIQDEHHRMLFPGRNSREVVLLVFRATWSPNDTQELPGRCYVTDQSLYFYAYYMGLVFTTVTPFSQILEVKAAPERDCDYLFLQLKPEPPSSNPNNTTPPPLGLLQPTGKRITLKTFLEPLRLLQRRLHFLIKNTQEGQEEVEGSAALLQRLIEMEKEVEEARGVDTESWEDVGFGLSPEASPGLVRRRAGGEEVEMRIRPEMSYGRGMDDRGVYMSLWRVGPANDAAAKEPPRLKLPTVPVEYTPPCFDTEAAAEKVFEVPAQALFHVIFGDRSGIFQALYAERSAQHIQKGEWQEQTNLDEKNGKKMSRSFNYQVNFVDYWGRSRKADVVDHQTIEKMDEHSCYVIRDLKTPWHLPHRQDFMLVSCIVITHVAATKCKLAIRTRVDWTRVPRLSKGIVETQALSDLTSDALDLVDIASDAIHKLGPSPAQTAPKRAIALFGPVAGRPALSSTANPSQTDAPLLALSRRTAITPRRLDIMLAETALSHTESAVTNILITLFRGLRAAGSILSAHRLLVLILVFSLFSNLLLSKRATVAWYTERRAARFLDSVHVSPGGTMTRAVTIADLDSFFTNTTTTSTSSIQIQNPTGACYRAFTYLTSIDDRSIPSTPLVHPHTQRMTTRVRAGRRRLGRVRHDLMVGMRLVNRIEKDLLAAEWEAFVASEMGPCGRMTTETAVGEEMMEFVSRYCGSCRREWEGIEEGGAGL